MTLTWDELTAAQRGRIEEGGARPSKAEEGSPLTGEGIWSDDEDLSDCEGDQ